MNCRGKRSEGKAYNETQFDERRHASGEDDDQPCQKRRLWDFRVAIADNRIEEIPLIPDMEEICAAYISDEIEAHELVMVYKKMVSESGYSSDQ